MLRITNKMYFDSDEDFYDFAVVPMYVVKERTWENGVRSKYYDFDLSYAYHDAVKKGMVFIIKDPDSQTFKRQAVTYGTITKPISNLRNYIFECYGNKKFANKQ